ncbi:ankyrin repeat and SOCS box protein 16 isoform X3 [Patella vulgata]|uniref:ankyrin repeat and SOCS box protein 16 isoform X3 n=1 Tax=Patella vulgata TaxID=6465 RepID=UPI0024A8BB31|nr:ankyrin repeat and SOCS box protein 16 isoform X3 [Patella vulgata]XP_055955080.1 ankyrin repeat and SOCS box protein 16 isoform X3 [Patella vulgata]XP_055955081.1 ankyrin repeat and SOCS box protein 16 isoform X3 [Patella vulgata]
MELTHGQLYHAAEDNNLERFRELIQMGADIEETYEDHKNIITKSILHVCCGKGRLEMINLLLDAGAYISVCDKFGQTPLMYCVMTQFIEIGEILLERDPTIVNDQDRFGKSALHIAADNGLVDCVKMLLSHGAFVDIQSSEGYTPLMVCCYCKADPESVLCIIKMLLDVGADVNIMEISSRTALQMAAVTLNLQVVEMLLAAGADPNIVDGIGRSPMTSAISTKVRPNFSGCVPPDLITLIIMLIQAGSNLDLGVCEFSNPLITAVSRQAESLVALFLSHGVNVNITFASRVTAILLATAKGDLPCIKQLLYYNTKLDMKGNVYRKREHVEYFFDSMEFAVDDGKFDLVKLFYDVGYNLSNLKYLFGKGNIPKALLDNPEMHEWLKLSSGSPRSLLDISIKNVREFLGLMPCEKVEKLPIPTKLKDMLLLKHILDIF